MCAECQVFVFRCALNVRLLHFDVIGGDRFISFDVRTSGNQERRTWVFDVTWDVGRGFSMCATPPANIFDALVGNESVENQ